MFKDQGHLFGCRCELKSTFPERRGQRKTLKGSASCHSRIQFQLASRPDSPRLMFDIQWGVFLIWDVSESITKKELFLSQILMYFLYIFIWALYGTYNVNSLFKKMEVLA